MAIAKLLGVGLMGVTLMGALPASSEAAHRHDRYCGHSGYYSRSYARPSYHAYRPRTYAYSYRPAPVYVEPYYDSYYDGAYYTSAPRAYVYAGPSYSRHAPAYHYHGHVRCYSPHTGLGIHLSIGR
jgi:hypothetical protein